ncbi:MAG: class I SAM-dependent methyltransferase [Hyphomonadaceae bacterium]|nr:class I SAM-dependent methyltransferase [Hyphomonadaceae bacterium]
MSMVSRAVQMFEAAPLPDALRRGTVAMLVARADRRLAHGDAEEEARFAAAMDARPIAEHTAAANAQHYEVPAAFFRECLGPRLKYSCCLYDGGAATLAQAEERALAETCAHADLKDGQRILELGCGWGSLTLWMGAQYPRAEIVAVSNSASQRAHIEVQAARLGLSNVRVITADMNAFEAEGRFDRIVSVEMFEHMSNWRALLTRCRGWLAPGGRLFLHVFAHRASPYRFEAGDRSDWIAQHFFTGGVMPSRNLIRNFADLFEVEAEWRWSGTHYEKTALDWLKNFDARIERIRPVLAETYGDAARLWEHRWRLFFMATAGLFGHAGGESWGVVHHRLKAA